MVLCVAVLAFVWLRQTADLTFEMRDEGFLLAQAARAATGELPHRDFEDVYGPAVYPVTALVLRSFGGEILPVQLFLAALKAAAVAAVFVAARSLVTGPFALLAALAAAVYWGRPVWMVNTPYAALYTVCLGVIALAAWIRADVRGSRRGEFAAGCVAGAAVLFKQTLGAMLAGGLVLSVWGLAMLDPPPAHRAGNARPALALWAAAALLPPLVVLPYLSPRDYLIHFFALHLLMAAIALGAVRRRGASLADVTSRVLPVASGILLPLLLAVLFYALAGGAGRLWDGMFRLPRQLQNYAVPVALPDVAATATGVALLGIVAAGLLALGGRRRRALCLLTASLFACALAWSRLAPEPGLVSRAFWGSPVFEELQLAWTGMLAVALAWPLLTSRVPSSSRLEVRALLPVLFFHILLCFEILPRAGWNRWMILGAATPVPAWLALRGYQIATESGGGAARRAAAAVLAGLIPVWLVAPVVALTVADTWVSTRRPLALPHASGLRLPENVAQQQEVGALERLVSHLRSRVPAHAPLFLMSSDFMILFLSDRRDLCPDLQLRLFLVGWGMLPGGPASGIDEHELLRRLEGEPDAVVIDRGGESSLRLRAALPAVAARVDAEFGETARFGSFRLLERRRPAVTPAP